MNATLPVTAVHGVGEALAAKLRVIGINTVQDLLEYVPFRYEDFSDVIRVNQITPGPVTIKVTISHVKARYGRGGLHITDATAQDETGSVKLTWFNQPYRANALKADAEYYVSGEFASNYKYFAITNPACELVSDFPVNTARLVPVYRLTKGLGLSGLRRAVKNALQSCQPKENLPQWILEDHALLPKAAALQTMHFPESTEKLSQARRRLGFEEIFELSLASELNKAAFKGEHSYKIPFNQEAIKEFVASLPFKLTDAQRGVTWEIFQDIAAGSPMNRLVEGDVGSGKTVVAAMTALAAMQHGLQVAFMAPTELLATQHAVSLQTLLSTTDFSDEILLLTGSLSKPQKKQAVAHIKSNNAKLVIGTHALFQEKVEFHKLGLLIVDEQHRFGVEQRKKLQAKATYMPHVLNMTATPIPRSLALTLYGEMDISIIDSLPPGRKKVLTKATIAENRHKIYASVVKELEKGKQAFVVCPQIEEGETGAVAVTKVYEELHKKILKKYKVALLHGKMTTEEKNTVMQSFVAGDTQVLVSTTVIEVGVDVPNATLMVVEGADRFGLAQLHQLRGRVGRGGDQSYCFLIASDNDSLSKRLRLMENIHDGFTLAEYDLELRGPGAIYGKLQHGALDLRVAKLSDTKLIASARQAAKECIARNDDLLQYPELYERVQQLRSITNFN